MTRRRISARTREAAAVACAQMATLRSGGDYTNGVFDLRCGDAAMCLAYDAAYAVGRLPLVSWSDAGALVWAEAEAMLRCGWSP